MPELVPILTKSEIQKKVATVAEKISADYVGSDLLVIGVLKGAVVFLSDLIRQLTIPVKVEFVRVSSYGENISSTGQIRLIHKPECEIKNKDILIVEDIIDTGLTISYLIDHFYSFGPKSVQICTFIDKQERREKKINIRYSCHIVEKGFLVGYGLDYAENYRYLPDVCQLKI
ncbi:MAG: hypoxanthine phosphoribosyltransferase [Desulfobacterales bacterium]